MLFRVSTAHCNISIDSVVVYFSLGTYRDYPIPASTSRNLFHETSPSSLITVFTPPMISLSIALLRASSSSLTLSLKTLHRSLQVSIASLRGAIEPWNVFEKRNNVGPTKGLYIWKDILVHGF